MKRDQAIRLIRAHREEIAALGVRRIALFGSVARDEGGPDSDVDVLVEFEGPPTFRGHMGLLVLLESLLGARVDLATPAMIRPELMETAQRDLLDVA